MEETGKAVPVFVPPLGWACGCTRRGASHAMGGKPCQDAWAAWSSSFLGEPLLAIAVADGHGGERHDLSHLGAALAVQAAVGELIACLPPIEASGASAKPVPPGRTGEFQDRVASRWRESVLVDARQRLGLPEGTAAGQETITRYGTTLLIALVDGTDCWLGQIGDGDILLVRPDGSIEAPIPGDPDLMGSVTYSLSSRDTPSLWRTARLPVGQGGLLLLATDGISDSFGNPEEGEFHVFARSMAERVAAFGIDRVGAALPGWLDGFSRMGSGDDMTLVLVSLNPSERAAEAAGTPGEKRPEEVGNGGGEA